MGAFPKPRSKPTIKPLATMNKRNLRNWELRLSLVHLVVIIGVITGSMLAAYVFGYLTGQTVGYENALASASANSARFPIAGVAGDSSLTAEQASNIYAKLGSATGAMQVGDDRGSRGALGAESGELPELGSIRTTADAPLSGNSELETDGLNVNARSVKDKTAGDNVSAMLERGLAAASSAKNAKTGSKPAKGFRSTASDLKVSDLSRPGLRQGDSGVEDRLARAREVGSRSDDFRLPSEGRSKKRVGETLGGLYRKQTDTTKDRAELVKSKKVEIEKKVSPPVEVVKTTKPAAAVSSIRGRVDAPAPKFVKKEQPKLVREERKQVRPSSVNSASASAGYGGRSFVRDVVPRGWYAQVSAPRQKRDAEQLASKLRSSGFPVMVEKARVRGQEYYRVIVGPEDSRERGDRLIGQLSREKYLPGTPFMRKIR